MTKNSNTPRLLTLTIALTCACGTPSGQGAATPKTPEAPPPVAKEATPEPAPQPAPPKSVPTAAVPRGLHGVLSSIPAENLVFGVNDFAAALRGINSMIDAFIAAPGGAALWAKLMRKLGPRAAMLPPSQKQLAACGVPLNGSFAFVLTKRGRGEHFMLDIDDAQKFRTCTSTMGRWRQRDSRGLTYYKFRGLMRAKCIFKPGRLYCAPRTRTLRELAAATKPQSSVWDELTVAQRKRLRTSTAYVRVPPIRPHLPSGLATGVIEKDGVTVQAQMRLGIAAPFVLGHLKPSKLLGLAAGSANVVHVRAHAGIVAMKRFLPMLKGGSDPKVGAALRTALGSLTGEVLAFSAKPDGWAMVLGMDPKQAKAAVQLATTQLKKLRKSEPKVRKMLKLSTKRIGKHKALIVRAKPQVDGRVMFDHQFAVVPGPTGLWVGNVAALKQHSQKAASSRQAFMATATDPLIKRAFSDKALVAAHGLPGNPIRSVFERLDAKAQAKLPKILVTITRILSFYADHVYTSSVAFSEKGTDGAEFFWRLRTLHRDGNTGDDAARNAYRKGLETTRPTGITTSKEHAALIASLKKSHPASRFGLLEVATSGLSWGIAGAMAAVAIPAFVRYQRRAKISEARIRLSQVKWGAKSYYQADHYDAKGNLLPAQFPKGNTGWTPRKRCCKQAGGYCAYNAKTWDKPVWKALRFSGPGKQRFQYRYRSRGKGKKASFTIEARGDLDCDGKYSSFVLKGRAKKGGDVVFEPIKEKNPTE